MLEQTRLWLVGRVRCRVGMPALDCALRVAPGPEQQMTGLGIDMAAADKRGVQIDGEQVVQQSRVGRDHVRTGHRDPGDRVPVCVVVDRDANLDGMTGHVATVATTTERTGGRWSRWRRGPRAVEALQCRGAWRELAAKVPGRRWLD